MRIPIQAAPVQREIASYSTFSTDTTQTRLFDLSSYDREMMAIAERGVTPNGIFTEIGKIIDTVSPI